MHLGDPRLRDGPGDVLPVAQGSPHGFTGIGPALLLEVSKPCRIADKHLH